MVGLPCGIEECCSMQKELGDAWPRTCVHELERLLKAHRGYGYGPEWLKRAQIMWHPDAKWVRAPVEVREVFGERARVIFTMLGTLMAKLAK